MTSHAGFNPDLARGPAGLLPQGTKAKRKASPDDEENNFLMKRARTDKEVPACVRKQLDDDETSFTTSIETFAMQQECLEYCCHASHSSESVSDAINDHDGWEVEEQGELWFLVPVNGLRAVEFGSFAIEWMRSREEIYAPEFNYLERHVYVKSSHRAKVISWLQNVAELFAFQRETFHMSANFFDRYLCGKHNFKPEKLQLVGVTSLLMAAKLQEKDPKMIAEYCMMTAHSVTSDDILAMELLIAKDLEWNLHPPVAVAWVSIFVKRGVDALDSSFSSSAELLNALLHGGKFMRMVQLLDAAVLFSESLKFAPSQLAAAAFMCVHDYLLESIPALTGLQVEDVDEAWQWLTQIDDVLPIMDLKYYQAAWAESSVPENALEDLMGRSVSDPTSLEKLLSLKRVHER